MARAASGASSRSLFEPIVTVFRTADNVKVSGKTGAAALLEPSRLLRRNAFWRAIRRLRHEGASVFQPTMLDLLQPSGFNVLSRGEPAAEPGRWAAGECHGGARWVDLGAVAGPDSS